MANDDRSAESRPAAQAPRVRVGTALKTLAAVGVVAAALIAVAVNVLVARFYKRWDWTTSGLYTLSGATKETLAALSEPIDVIVFLSASDPMTVSIRHMLSAYGAETTRVHARYVDPDRSPAEFMALQQQYGILAGKTDDGRVVTDASIVIARGQKHWFVTSDDLVSYEENEGKARPRLEQALTEGIRNVLERERAKICFTTGHQEIALDDGGPMGLGELKHRLMKSNFDVDSVDLAAPGQKTPLEPCRVVIVSGPEQAFADKAVQRIVDYLKGGGNVLLVSNPLLDEENRIRSNGLEPLARAAGVEFQNDFIIERAQASRLPQGLGETFFAEPRTHDITKGLLRGDKPAFKVLVSNAQSLKPVAGMNPTPLLVTSAEAFSVRDIRPFTEEGKAVEKGPNDPSGPFTVAVAAELPRPPGSNEKHGPRVMVVGTANVVWSQIWRDSTVLGNRLFIESALSWLAARPSIVSVPEKPTHDVGLNLTEESLGEVWRYVLLYMPGAALLMGGFVLYRRRAVEKRSRRRGEDDAEPKPGEGEQTSGDDKTDDARAPASDRDRAEPE